MLAEGGGHALCSVPFTSVFIGYDGLYYLCCSDWRKQAPVGSVFDTDIAEAARRKFQHVSTGEPVCKTCNLDPLNRLTDELRGVARGEVTMEDAEAMAAEMLRVNQAIHDGLARLDDDVALPRRLRTSLRRRIPVRAG